MAEEVENMYGYQEDEVKLSPFVFGLNAGKTFLKEFKFIPNGGKDGAEQEALEIVFTINGTDRGYRQFPVTQAYGKNNEVITDPKSPEFKAAFTDFNAKITHILHAFQPIEAVKAGLARPVRSFKEFCDTAAKILPSNFKDIPLDIFLGYQWNLRGEAKRTYLEIPSKMKYGAWLKPAQPGTWKEIKTSNPDDNVQKALMYGKEETAQKDADGNITAFTEFHPFFRNGWYMNSNFAKQQRAEGEPENAPAGATGETTGGIPPAPQNAPPAASW